MLLIFIYLPLEVFTLGLVAQMMLHALNPTLKNKINIAGMVHLKLKKAFFPYLHFISNQLSRASDNDSILEADK